MKQIPFLVKKYGSNGVLLEWTGTNASEILFDMLGFTDFLRTHYLVEPEWETIPIYRSLTIIYRENSEKVERIISKLPQWYTEYPGPKTLNTQHWELPVCYDTEFGLDLEAASQTLNLSVDELISLHGQVKYRVYGLGFLPGFLYLGGVPVALRLPRKSTPRQQVLAGAVGLADFQTGIYPQVSPGGWNIIGNCPVPLFNPHQNPPCFIKAGDTVQFFSVSRAAFDLYRLEVEVGVYDIYKKFSDD